MTLVATSGSPWAPLVPAAGPAQSPENRLEQVLIHHLMNGVVESLTDRTGTSHSFPWRPEQRVRIGVLGVTYRPLPPAAPAGQAGSSRGPGGDGAGDGQPGDGPAPAIAAPIDNRGVIGVDFVVSGDASEISLTVDVDYALYHPMLPAFADIAADAATRAAAGGANPRRRPRVPVNPSWSRDNRRVTLQIAMTVGPDETVFASDHDIPGGDPLEADASAAVTAHYADPRALFKLTHNQTMPVADAMGSEAELQQALAGRREANWEPSWARPRLTVVMTPTVSGNLAVSVSIRNAREVTDRPLQDLSIYDTRMTVTVEEPHQLEPQRLHFADDDVRYAEAATVVGRGRGCVAGPGQEPNTVVAETLPIYVQHVAEPLDHGADLRFSTLAVDYGPTLETVAAAMRSFLRSWDSTGDGSPEGRAQLETLRELFEKEVERFELGVDLFRGDNRLAHAFKMANRAFAKANGNAAAWRLFQLVFIITELGALAGHETPTTLDSEGSWTQSTCSGSLPAAERQRLTSGLSLWRSSSTDSVASCGAPRLGYFSHCGCSRSSSWRVSRR